MCQHFARSCLVPLLLTALLSGVPPAGAGSPPEENWEQHWKDCETWNFDGQHWSCKDPVKDRNNDVFGFLVFVILVSFALVLAILKATRGLDERRCPQCKRRQAMEEHGVMDQGQFSGRVQWVCKYCRYAQWKAPFKVYGDDGRFKFP